MAPDSPAPPNPIVPPAATAVPGAGELMVGADGATVSTTTPTAGLRADRVDENGATWVAETVCRPSPSPGTTQPQLPALSAGKVQEAPVSAVTVTEAPG